MVSITDFQNWPTNKLENPGPALKPIPGNGKTPKIGVGLVGFGLFFILFGVLLYFDSVLLAFGNILFLSGLAIIIGLQRTFRFFFQKEKLKGTSFFLGGILIVLLRWPLLGMLLETYGFIALFRNFFPVVFGFLGTVGNIPLLSKLFQKLGDTSSLV